MSTWTDLAFSKNTGGIFVCAAHIYRQSEQTSQTGFPGPGWCHALRATKLKRKIQCWMRIWPQIYRGLSARHLLLDGHVRYTGPAMKRACAVWNADAGVTNLEIMMHLAWKNAFRASRYTSGSEAGQRHAVDHTTVNIGRGEGRGGIC